ncbi:MAG: hypothetical protein K2L12_01625 [Clostridia bacterium]|nr:hypothetical protein [Clostridia bacterium]
MKKRVVLFLFAILLVATSVFSITACSVLGITACSNADNDNELLEDWNCFPEQPEPEKPAPEITPPNENGEKGEQSSFGSFYTLQEAYNKGWLTRADLMNIAYYHHSTLNWGAEFIPEGYNPAPKTPEVLSGETLTAIKQTYWDNNYKVNNPHNVTLDDIDIGEDYYGTYNNCVAVMIWLNGAGYGCAIGDYYVGNVRFLYPDTNDMCIWVAGDTEPSQVNELPVLDETKSAEIRTAYYNTEKKYFTSEYYTFTADDISFRYYGEYSGLYVMFIDVPFFDYTLAIERYWIDGVPFVYGSGQCLAVYDNGNFYYLNRAFENTLFTQDDLLEISYRLGYGLYTKA